MVTFLNILPQKMRKIRLFTLSKIRRLYLSVLFFFFVFTSFSHSYTISELYIASGTRAPYGYYQYISVIADGTMHVDKQELNNSSSKKTLNKILTTAEMQALYDKAVEVGLFGLNDIYDSQAIDGSGVSITIKATNGTQKTVQVYNYKQEAVSKFIKKVNEYLPDSPVSFKIDYSYLD